MLLYNLSLEDLIANLNVCIRYGFTCNPKPPSTQLKMHQHYRDSSNIDSDKVLQYIDTIAQP